MNRAIHILSIFLCSMALTAQNFPVGHRSITYNDPARSRNIPVHVYYPALTAGDNTQVASGQFPLLVFGHGFAMSYAAYENVWEALVPLGYIIVLPTTEGSLTGPDHDAFGKDLRFLNTKLKSEGSNSASPFYQKVAATSAIMGHSMGGGASFLAAENNSDLTTLVTFAPADTDPPAIDAAAAVTVPALIFYGENDGVTPPAQHQIPMYNALASACKTMIGINGGGHCYFADYNFYCSTGELATSPQPTITRAEQHDVLFDFLIPYLKGILYGDATAAQLFLDSLSASARITHQRFCPTTGFNVPFTPAAPHFEIYPNPLPQGASLTLVQSGSDSDALAEVYDSAGRAILTSPVKKGNNELGVLPSSGIYTIRVLWAGHQRFERLVVL